MTKVNNIISLISHKNLQKCLLAKQPKAQDAYDQCKEIPSNLPLIQNYILRLET